MRTARPSLPDIPIHSIQTPRQISNVEIEWKFKTVAISFLLSRTYCTLPINSGHDSLSLYDFGAYPLSDREGGENIRHMEQNLLHWKSRSWNTVIAEGGEVELQLPIPIC